MYEPAHCFRIVSRSFIVLLNRLGKAFQKGLTKYDYTCRLSCRTCSAQEKLHVVERMEELHVKKIAAEVYNILRNETK